MKTKIFLAVILALTLSLVLSVSIFASEDDPYSTELYDGDTHLCTMTFENGRMTIESHYTGWWEWSPSNEVVKTFITTYKDLTTNIVFTGKFGKIHVNAGETYTFAGAENLVSVCFPKDARILDYSGAFNVFSGCTALTTVYFGNEADMKMGVVDFRGMKCDKDDSPTRFIKGMFKDCTSITEVILPAFNNGSDSYGNDNNPTIFSDTFEGCTNLRSITVPEAYETIQNGAFDAAKNLKTLNYSAPVSLITNDTFKGVHNGLIINVSRSDDVTAINNALAEGGVDQSSVVARVAALYSGWVVNGDDGHTEEGNIYCKGTLNTHAKTNIKWEVFNEGTAEAPSYTLYFSIDDDGYAAAFPEGKYYGNTILYGYILFGGGNSFVHACGYGGSDGGDKHPWVATTGIDLKNFKKIVIGDGITECNGGTFACMTGVTTLEMPTSLTVFNGVVLKGCESLSTVYTRGQTPVEGVFNLSNIKNITTTNYSFCACKAVERYIFAEDAKMSELSPQIFLNNTSLKEITIPEGVYRANASAFGGCTALEEVTLPASLNGPLHAKSFENCTSLKKITIKGNPTIEYDSTATDKAGVTAENAANAFYNCPVLETINAPIGSNAQQFAVKFGFESSHVAELYNNDGVLLCTMTYYPKDYKMTIVSHSNSFWEWTPMNETVKAFVDAYMGKTEHVVFTGNFGKIHTRSRIAPFDSVFMNAENLISVCFPKNARVLDYSAEGGAFAGCTNLTTIYFGNEADMKMGVIDFSGMRCDKDDFPTTFLKSMFSGCTGITEVILPALNNGLATNGTDNNPTIYADTFKDCSKLTKITVPETYETIENGAFDTCVDLKTIVYNAPAILVTSGTFAGVHSNLIIQVQSYDDVTAINKALAEGGVAHSSVSAYYKQGMSITGYQVRTTGYNGLRTVFSFYDNAFGNYELVEVGSIVATSANFDKYAASFGGENSILNYVDGKFVTPDSNVIKTAVYSEGKFVGKYTDTENGFDFSVTVTRFTGQYQYKAEIVNCGYEVWKTTDGNYYVVFTCDGEEGYESNSLYKTTLGMLCGGAITIEKSDNPIYNTLMDCDYETFSPTAGVDGYLFEDALDSTKRIAVYLTDSSSPITLTEAGLGKEVSNVSHMVFGKNVVLSLPEIDDYWVEHINKQLATLPEGRSFIAITDTHYQSGGYGNVGKSADLMQYVRQMTGIEKVINLGDPFHQENTYEGAKEQLSRSMEEKFFNYFGDDGMYAIGNHDSNITMARNAEDLAIDPTGLNYKMDLLLSDKDIYDLTFAHIEEGGKNNKNIVYDEKLLSIIEANKSEVKEFVLDNVAPEDAGDTRMFGNVNYSADEMYANLVSWAKMHYAYYDHESKICYIVLNTGGLTVTDFATLGCELWRFHPSQYEFLNTMLTDIATNHSDYDVVVAGHMFYDADEAGNSYNQNLFKMLSAFEGRGSVSISASGNNAFSGKLFGCTDGAKSRTISYNFEEISKDFTGEVFCITGHRHLDLHLVSQTKDEQYYMSVAYDTVADNLSDNAVQLILLNQDNYAESKSSAEGDNVQTMTKGTITEHSFTIFTITDNNTLVATRIGANSGWLQKEFKLG